MIRQPETGQKLGRRALLILLAAGFSNGAGMAEYVALQRPVAGVLMLSGALPLEMIGVAEWPAGVPAQIHYATEDPFRDQQGIDAVANSVRAAGASIERAGLGAREACREPILHSRIAPVQDPDSGEGHLSVAC